MDLLYSVLLFLHIIAAFLFVLAHGASAAVAFRLRREEGPERVRALLDLSGSTFGLMFLSLLVVLAAGIALGFVRHWWSSGWIWTAIVLFVAVLAGMSLMASTYFARVRKAVGLPFRDGNREHPPVDPASPEALRALLQDGKPNLIAAIGFGGWALILLLMVFKPY